MLVDTRASAEYMRTNGWTTHQYRNDAGKVCLFGAVIHSHAPMQRIGPMSEAAEDKMRDLRAVVSSHLNAELRRYTNGEFNDIFGWNDEVADEAEVLRFLESIEPFEIT